MYREKMKKATLILTAIAFIFTNSLYGAPISRSYDSFSLRIPLGLKGGRGGRIPTITAAIAQESQVQLFSDHFGREVNNTEQSLVISADGKDIALARYDETNQILHTSPLQDPVTAEEKNTYYSAILTYTSDLTNSTGKEIELVDKNGDLMKTWADFDAVGSAADSAVTKDGLVVRKETTFTAGGGLAGRKTWYRENLGYSEPWTFQMEYRAGTTDSAKPTMLTFKKSKDSRSRGYSAIIKPKTTVLVVAPGQIGILIARWRRRMGDYVEVANRSANIERAGEAFMNGFRLWALEEDGIAGFKKAGMPVQGAMDRFLEQGVDIVFDCTDKDDTYIDPESSTEITTTVGVKNYKLHYKQYTDKGKTKVVFQGNNPPTVGTFYDQSLLQKLEQTLEQYTGKSIEDMDTFFEPSCNTHLIGFILDTAALLAKKGTLSATVKTDRRDVDRGQKGKKFPTKGQSGATIYHHSVDYLHGRQNTPLMGAWEMVDDPDNASGEQVPHLITGVTLTPYDHHVSHATVRGTSETTGKPITADEIYNDLKQDKNLVVWKVKGKKYETAEVIQMLIRMELIHNFLPTVIVFQAPGQVEVVAVNPQESIVIPDNIRLASIATGTSSEDVATRLTDDVMGLSDIRQHMLMRSPLEVLEATNKTAVSLDEFDATKEARSDI